MPEKYIAKQGDCLSSIAESKGMFWRTIWDNSANKALHDRRKDPNVLFPGDEIWIPDKVQGVEKGETEKRHVFRRKGIPAKIRIVLLDDKHEPRRNLPYLLVVDGEVFSGSTNSDGALEHQISPKAVTGNLRVGRGHEEVYALSLGHLDPHDEIQGVQERLKNLGFECGTIDGVAGSKTEEAVRAFQKRFGLQETGIIDEATRNQLKQLHKG